MYEKGGSAYFQVEGNEFYDCGTGGFTAGQGTGFQFVVAPWLHYEAYNIKVINNIIHSTDGAGLGVNGDEQQFIPNRHVYVYNTVEPQFADLSCGFALRLGGTLLGATTFALPSFPGGDRPTLPASPPGTLASVVAADRDGRPRVATSLPGAYVVAHAAGCTRLPLVVR
jgi:hypothetical protein